MAPDNFEVDEETESDKPISNTPKLDIWSLGCMISELLSGIYPWFNLTKQENKVETYLIKKHAFPIPKEIDAKYPEYKPIIESCTKLNPIERSSADDVIDFLKNTHK